MARVITTGVAGLKSETWYPMPPIEWGRSGGTVTAITVVGNGTAEATSQTGRATTSSGRGSGLIVSTTAAAGVVTAITPTTGGDNYRLGDLITVTGGNGTSPITGRVTGLSYTN